MVQVANPAYQSSGSADRYSMDLYEVKEGGGSRMLFSSIEQSKFQHHIIKSIGDISYKDGVLCWSTFESVWCEKWPRTTANPNVYQIIKPGDATQVCNVSSYFQKYQNIITGIDLISANDRIEMIFGCWSSWTNNGGAGYMNSNSNGTDKRIKAIADKKGKILAGNVAIINDCPNVLKQKNVSLRALLQEVLNDRHV